MSRGYKYGKKSLEKLNGVKSNLKEVMLLAMQIANTRKLYCPDFGIGHGLRTTDEQQELFAKGRECVNGQWVVTGNTVTNCDGVNKKSNHQSGKAVDIYAYVNGKANYEHKNLALIASCVFEAACRLNINIKWGGNFKSFEDLPHFEVE